MFLRYYELKEMVYFGQTVLGVLLIIAAICEVLLVPAGSIPGINMIVGLILFITGGACIMFGIETYLLRDDPDVWR